MVHNIANLLDDPWQLPIVDTPKWIGQQPPLRRYIVDEWLVRATAGMFVGEDGVGKSLLGQELCTCVAAGLPFVGLKVTQCPTLYISAEDDEDELWRRQRSINKALGLPLDAAPASLSSLVGHINIALGTFDDQNRFHTSRTFDAIAERALEVGTGLVVLDNLAHFFTGNENARNHVAAYSSALDHLAKRTDAAVLQVAHPNKSGAEYSGSTGWSAHFRQRWFLECPDDGTASFDRDARVLRKSKANYSESGTEVRFRWHDWAFVRDEDLPPETLKDLANTAKASAENDAFMHCLALATERKRAVSHNPGSNYAPKVFAAMPEGKGFKPDAFKAGMERLISLGQIALDQPLWRGPNRVMKQGIKATENCTDPPAQPPCTDLHETRGNAARFTPPYTTYIGAALEAAAPIQCEDDAASNDEAAFAMAQEEFEPKDPADWD